MKVIEWTVVAMCLVVIAQKAVEASERIRLYDENDKFSGHIQRYERGSDRFYDRDGRLVGTCRGNRCKTSDGKVLPLYNRLRPRPKN